ncbi:hypothetical protein ACHFJ0_05110 [Paracoccus sp. NGMCC 1.201697]|uniref:Uncharacterized protein n=1 Tax=Paracoccus broussonetiae subsp. drimophilus TaxID=3373869 RepID=A0ABW7LHC1_9RHOB
MQAARIKKGASFKATLTFEADEWASLYPWTSVEAKVGQGSRRYPLTVATDVPNMRLTVTATAAETASWVTDPKGAAPASFDVWVTKGTEVLPVPASTNVPLIIIEGITR